MRRAKPHLHNTSSHVSGSMRHEVCPRITAKFFFPMSVRKLEKGVKYLACIYQNLKTIKTEKRFCALRNFQRNGNLLVECAGRFAQPQEILFDLKILGRGQLSTCHLRIAVLSSMSVYHISLGQRITGSSSIKQL